MNTNIGSTLNDPISGFVADFHFWIAVVGSRCDKGNATRQIIVDELVRLTSLTPNLGNGVINTMLSKGKLIEKDGIFECTMRP